MVFLTLVSLFSISSSSSSSQVKIASCVAAVNTSFTCFDGLGLYTPLNSCDTPIILTYTVENLGVRDELVTQFTRNDGVNPTLDLLSSLTSPVLGPLAQVNVTDNAFVNTCNTGNSTFSVFVHATPIPVGVGCSDADSISFSFIGGG